MPSQSGTSTPDCERQKKLAHMTTGLLMQLAAKSLEERRWLVFSQSCYRGLNGARRMSGRFFEVNAESQFEIN